MFFNKQPSLDFIFFYISALENFKSLTILFPCVNKTIFIAENVRLTLLRRVLSSSSNTLLSKTRWKIITIYFWYQNVLSFRYVLKVKKFQVQKDVHDLKFVMGWVYQRNPTPHWKSFFAQMIILWEHHIHSKVCRC